MTSGFRLDAHLVVGSALDKARHILGVPWPCHGDRLNGDGEVVAVDPVDLVEKSVGVGDAVCAAVADRVETALQAARRARALTHDAGSDVVDVALQVVMACVRVPYLLKVG